MVAVVQKTPSPGSLFIPPGQTQGAAAFDRGDGTETQARAGVKEAFVQSVREPDGQQLLFGF